MSDEARSFRPVFVVGFGRSGTTLLTTILGRHPNLAATPETHLMDLVLPEDENMVPARRASVEEMRARFEASPRSGDMQIALDDLPQQADTYADFFRGVLSFLAERAGKGRVVEKTPLHLTYTPTLLGWYPRATVICIVRDGRDAVRSMMAQSWTHDNLYRHCRLWRHYAELSLAYEGKYPDFFKRVHYEELVEDPELVVRRINSFIDEDFAPEQLAWGNDEAVATIPEWERDWKHNAVAMPDASRIGRWREEATPYERDLMNVVMGEQLAAMDYSDTSIDHVGFATVLKHRAMIRFYAFAYESPLTPLFRFIKRMFS